MRKVVHRLQVALLVAWVAMVAFAIALVTSSGPALAEDYDADTELLDAGVQEEQSGLEGAGDGLEAQSACVSNPRMMPDSSMNSGQVTTWDCVWFGSYPQTEVASGDAVYASLESARWNANGDATVGGVRYHRISKNDTNNSGHWGDGEDDDVTYRYFRYEPVKWRVLEVSGTTAFVMADTALDDQCYNTESADVTWETCSVRSWLNGYGASSNQPGTDYSARSFQSTAFSSSELGAVLMTTVVNADNIEYNTAGGSDTSDRVFLLGKSEVCKAAYGFATSPDTYDEARYCEPSDYAHAMGVFSDYSSGRCWWWLRSPGSNANRACKVYDGDASCRGSVVAGGMDAVRPALNLDLSSPYVQPAGTVSSNGSVDETAPTGGEHEEVNRRFALGSDNNNFTHSSDKKEYPLAGFAEVDDYHISELYFDELTSGLSRGAKNGLKKKMWKSPWEGSCAGIAISMGLLYEGRIDISDLTDGGASSYYTLDYPSKDPKFLSAIQYYQLTQGMWRTVSLTVNHTLLQKLAGTRDAVEEDLPSFLRRLVNHCLDSEGHVTLFGYNYWTREHLRKELEGHAVLITGCEYDKESGEYILTIYDVNTVDVGQEEGAWKYLFVKKDFSSFACYKDKDKDKGVADKHLNMDYYVMHFCDWFFDWDKADEILPQGDQGDAPRMRIEFPQGEPFTVTNSEGEYLAYDGEELSGDLPVYDIAVGEASVVGGSQRGPEICVETVSSDEFALTGLGESIEFEVYDRDGFVSLNGAGVTGASLSIKDGVEVSGSDYSFTAHVTTYEEVAEGEYGLISVSADARGDVEVRPNGPEVGVSAGGRLANVETKSYVGADVCGETYASAGSSFRVNDDGEIVESPSEIASGTWGTCPWEIDADGTLTVHPGTGADTDWKSPWGAWSHDIRAIRFVSEGGRKVVAPADCSCLFSELGHVASADLSGFDTSSTTDMNYMFCECYDLASLNVSGWDTARVQDMSHMFVGCGELTALDLSGWDTSSATSMEGMFEYCSPELFRVGKGYRAVGEDGVPEPPSESGKWWSELSGKWLTRSQVGSRRGVADTYLAAPSPFVDVTSRTSHYEDILWLADTGVSAGWTNANGTREFRPKANVARCDMAAFLFRLAKRWGVVEDSWQPKGTYKFVDVTEKTSHRKEVLWMAESGISTGWVTTKGAEFRPKDPVTRGQMAAFMQRLAVKVAGKKGGAGSPEDFFRDVSAKTSFHGEIWWLAGNGVTQGWGSGASREFRPNAKVTRGDMAAFLHRLDGVE